MLAGCRGHLSPWLSQARDGPGPKGLLLLTQMTGIYFRDHKAKSNTAHLCKLSGSKHWTHNEKSGAAELRLIRFIHRWWRPAEGQSLPDTKPRERTLLWDSEFIWIWERLRLEGQTVWVPWQRMLALSVSSKTLPLGRTGRRHSNWCQHWEGGCFADDGSSLFLRLDLYSQHKCNRHPVGAACPRSFYRHPWED